MKLKVLSLNLYEGKLIENAINFIQQEDPDIFCLQEVFNGRATNLSKGYRSLELLKTAFPNFHYYFSPELLCITDEGKIDIGNVIFSRFSITEKSTHFFNIPYGEYPKDAPNGDWSKDPHNLQHCEVKILGDTLNIFNAHGVWGFDGDDNPDRLFMSRVIVNQIKDRKKIILVGDFNVKPNTETIRNIEKHVTSLFNEALTTSFNLVHKNLVKSPGYATAVVDMFFVSQDIQIVNKKVPANDVSDHLPLICELKV